MQFENKARKWPPAILADITGGRATSSLRIGYCKNDAKHKKQPTTFLTLSIHKRQTAVCDGGHEAYCVTVHKQVWVKVSAPVDGGVAEIVSLLSRVEGLQTLQNRLSETPAEIR